MHQISLLGGLGHTLRPDRVYRTGVLAPMAGFRPGEAVMATTDAFTSGPYSGMSLKGLRAAGVPFGQRVKVWWAGVKSRAAQGRGPMVQSQAPTTTSAVVTTTSPATFVQHNLAPMAAYGDEMTGGMPHAMVSRAYGQSPSLPAYAAEAAAKSTMMRWRGVRWPW